MANDKKKMVEAITAQEVDFAQWYTDICTKAELVEYSSVKGFVVLRPYGYAIWENIQKNGQVAVGVQHMAEMVAEHRFAGGAHSKALFQRVRTACSDPGNFGGKAVYQLALLFQQAFGDQHKRYYQ